LPINEQPCLNWIGAADEVLVVNLLSRRELMVALGVMLTMWLKAFVNPSEGFGACISTPTKDERIDLRLGCQPSTQEIANAIVTQGSGGMWTLRTNFASTSATSTVDFSVEPYRHYTNIAGEAMPAN
jgi:hypothetical protein